MSVIRDFSPDLIKDIPVGVILRMSGYQDIAKADQRVINTTAELIKLAREIARPAVLYQKTPCQVEPDRIIILPAQQFTGKKLLQRVQGCDGLVVAVLTLGRQIEDKSRQMLSGEVFAAYLFDVISSYLVEMIAEIFWQQLKNELNSQGLKVTSFISPGSKDFPLTAQKTIFEILRPENKLGLRLSDTYLIEPTKSLTAIMGYGNRIEEAAKSHNCADCELSGCMFRGIHR